MSQEPLSLVEAAQKVIKEKQDLLLKHIKPQLEDLLKREITSPLTAQHFQLAVDNFDKSLIELNKGEDYYQAMYFFSRGCVNLGQLQGKVEKEKKAS
jgi:hypothetical protein